MHLFMFHAFTELDPAFIFKTMYGVLYIIYLIMRLEIGDRSGDKGQHIYIYIYMIGNIWQHKWIGGRRYEIAVMIRKKKYMIGNIGLSTADPQLIHSLSAAYQQLIGSTSAITRITFKIGHTT